MRPGRARALQLAGTLRSLVAGAAGCGPGGRARARGACGEARAAA